MEDDVKLEIQGMRVVVRYSEINRLQYVSDDYSHKKVEIQQSVLSPQM